MIAGLQLTPEMERARASARAHGGKLARYPGGFWVAGEFNPAQDPRPAVHFGTSTVEALVNRGLMAYTDFKYRGDGSSFPIMAELTEPAEANK